jgi:hypothetical protein
LSLPQLLAAERGKPAPKARAKSCLLIFMEGGPSHIDLWDMKPEAPSDIRGEFQPIRTQTPGVHVCNHLPLMAKQWHHLAQVRSVTHTITDHNAGSYYMLSGRYPVEGAKLVVSESSKNFPTYGAVLAKFRPTGKAMPDFVHIPEIMSNNNFDIPGEGAGFLGARYEPFITGDPSLPDFVIPGMQPTPESSGKRLDDRTGLLHDLDLRSRLAKSDDTDRLDVFHRKAFELVRSDDVRKAFDLSREPVSTRERYGVDTGSDRAIEARKFGGLPQLGQSMLLARRMIEAGVRLVTLITGRRIDQAWDTHRDHFPLLKRSLLPPFDRACSALLEDMHVRGLLDETLVVIMGEFGRTPKLGYITSGAGADKNGRDHWPFCYTVMFAGAGVNGGAIVGSSDRIGAYPSLEPVKPEDVAATIYRILGLADDAEIVDTQGKPYALIQGQAIKGV